ncbi:MAG: hypothetical protein R3F08_10695 [Dokdonella sp.]
MATAFRFVRNEYADGEARLVYAFDDGLELVERIASWRAGPWRQSAQRPFGAALDLLHLIAGVSYYKAGVPGEIRIESTTIERATAAFLDDLYLHGLGEFAYTNKSICAGRSDFPSHARRSGESRDPVPLRSMQELDSGLRRR